MDQAADGDFPAGDCGVKVTFTFGRVVDGEAVIDHQRSYETGPSTIPQQDDEPTSEDVEVLLAEMKEERL